jgi:hypothetical protein
MNFSRTLIAAALISTALATSAFAQATITQAKAEAGNVTPGDGAGFPVTISKAGSYKLMSNLVVPAGVNGIEITADRVSLDLNGFSITGTVSCSFNSGTYTVSCDGNSATRGVATLFDPAVTLIQNGQIGGFDYGIVMAGGRAERLSLRGNASGIYAACTTTGTVRIAEVEVTLSVVGIKLDCTGGLISNATAAMNSIGFSGGNTGSALSDSHASRNNVGVQALAVHGVRAVYNKTDLLNTQAY